VCKGAFLEALVVEFLLRTFEAYEAAIYIHIKPADDGVVDSRYLNMEFCLNHT
jgi:hypothetical protein